MPHTGIVFEIASQDANGVTFTVDITDAARKYQRDRAQLWVGLTSVDANGNVVVAQNLPVFESSDPGDATVDDVTFEYGGVTPTHSFAHVWDFPNSGNNLATLEF